jgi:hypothetical protein
MPASDAGPFHHHVPLTISSGRLSICLRRGWCRLQGDRAVTFQPRRENLLPFGGWAAGLMRLLPTRRDLLLRADPVLRTPVGRRVLGWSALALLLVHSRPR